MAKHSITAVFDTRSHAEQAIAELKSAGFSAGDIVLLPEAGETLDMTDTGRTKGFWASLEALFGGTDDHATYAESLRRGGFVVSVRAEDAAMDQVVDILERHGSVDLDERETTWRGEGWTGSTSTSSMSTGALGAAGVGGAVGSALSTAERRDTAMPAAFVEPVAPAATVVTERAVMDRATVPVKETALRGDDVIQVVEERLDIGKRAVSRGKVRVRSSVVAREVSESVTLHEETVTIDRRVVDRPASTLSTTIDPFQERVIEMEEFDEEAVVAKSVHVVEEIGIRKDAADRVETVRDTLRSTKVDIDDGRGVAVTGTGEAMGILREIRDDMEVVGSDGLHVGTVDHLDGGRIKLKKVDPAAGGEHHYLAADMVSSVAGKIMLAVTAAEAKARWTAAG